jgi:hypothetical protein
VVSSIRIWPYRPAPVYGPENAPVLEYGYLYDDSGRCTNFSRPYESIRDQYGYDAVGRLVVAARETHGVCARAQWIYDTAGTGRFRAIGRSGLAPRQPSFLSSVCA